MSLMSSSMIHVLFVGLQARSMGPTFGLYLRGLDLWSQAAHVVARFVCVLQLNCQLDARICVRSKTLTSGEFVR